MAFAYDDAGLPIAVATLGGANIFSGPITFSSTTASTSTSTGAVVIYGGLGVQGNIYGSKVWGCVWNDLADCIDVPESTDLEYGYCYCFDGENYYKVTIDPSCSYIEFTENYEIVEQEGEIYTIKERVEK